MKIYRLGRMADKKGLLKRLGVEPAGVTIMSAKMELYYFYIKNLRTPAANILKQDALSIGAELAVPVGVVSCSSDSFDAILIGTRKHIEILSRKEMAQPFGLKILAKRLKSFLATPDFPLRIMGVINANEDSFYAGSRFLENDALTQIGRMIEEGASIIDIGAVSSRPGAEKVDADEEMRRIRPIVDMIKERKLHEKALFSIDSYTPAVVEYACQSGFGLINDITGASDSRIIDLARRYGVRLCIMHMQGTPQTMQKNPYYDDVMIEVSDFFEERIARCEAGGVGREQIILDVGIGFGKSLEHNLALIRNLSHFQKFGCEILIGASRKSMIDKIVTAPTEARLPGTLAIHLKAVENGASIVRCHDVAEHRQALAVWEAMQ